MKLTVANSIAATDGTAVNMFNQNMSPALFTIAGAIIFAINTPSGFDITPIVVANARWDSGNHEPATCKMDSLSKNKVNNITP